MKVDSQNRLLLGKANCVSFAITNCAYIAIDAEKRSCDYLVISPIMIADLFTICKVRVDEKYRICLPKQALNFFGDKADLYVGTYQNRLCILKKDW